MVSSQSSAVWWVQRGPFGSLRTESLETVNEIKDAHTDTHTHLSAALVGHLSVSSRCLVRFLSPVCNHVWGRFNLCFQCKKLLTYQIINLCYFISDNLEVLFRDERFISRHKINDSAVHYYFVGYKSQKLLHNANINIDPNSVKTENMHIPQVNCWAVNLQSLCPVPSSFLCHTTIVNMSSAISNSYLGADYDWDILDYVILHSQMQYLFITRKMTV